MRILDAIKGNPHFLTEDDIASWAAMTYWAGTEAVILSLGIDPRKKGDAVDSRKAAEISEEYIQRVHVLEAFNIQEHAKEGHRFSGNYVDLNCVPRTFMQWAREHYRSVPEELYEAVLEPVPRQKARSAPAHGKKSKGNPGSDARWAFKYQIQRRAKAHLEATPCVDCDHLQLAEYLLMDAVDARGASLFNLYEYPGLNEPLLQTFLKEAANDFLSERAPQRVVGNKGYKKSLGHCEIHGRKRK